MTTIQNSFRSLKQFVLETPIEQLTTENIAAAAKLHYRSFPRRIHVFLTDLEDIAHEIPDYAKGTHLLQNILGD